MPRKSLLINYTLHAKFLEKAFIRFLKGPAILKRLRTTVLVQIFYVTITIDKIILHHFDKSCPYIIYNYLILPPAIRVDSISLFCSFCFHCKTFSCKDNLDLLS